MKDLDQDGDGEINYRSVIIPDTILDYRYFIESHLQGTVVIHM